MFRPDQKTALSSIIETAETDDEVFALYLFGSWGTELADLWSDLDLLSITVDPSREWLPNLGDVFAKDISTDERGVLSRLIYEHGLFVDLLNVSSDSISSINSWSRVPFHQGVRPLTNGCADFDEIVLNAVPTSSKPELSTMQRSLDKVRFLATQSIKKYARGERQISEHLALETLQEAMVCAMIAQELSESFSAPGHLQQRGSVEETVIAASEAADAIGCEFVDDYKPGVNVVRSLCEALPDGHT